MAADDCTATGRFELACITSMAGKTGSSESLFDLLCADRRNRDTIERLPFTAANPTAVLRVETDTLIVIFVMDITVNNDLLAQDSGVVYTDGCQRGDNRGERR